MRSLLANPLANRRNGTLNQLQRSHGSVDLLTASKEIPMRMSPKLRRVLVRTADMGSTTRQQLKEPRILVWRIN
jgi:hypothetical protein